MDSIYENSELTIIAAAGVDQNHGLPGAGKPPRLQQLTASIGNFTFISTLRPPSSCIRTSKWSTRGWTFQEAILSRRCLVFTEHQVYFECNGMNCQESVWLSLDKAHKTDKSQFKTFMPGGVFCEKKPSWIQDCSLCELKVFKTFMDILEEYTRRQLRYESDALNAIAGIMARSERFDKTPIFHFWGLPYLYSSDSQVRCN